MQKTLITAIFRLDRKQLRGLTATRCTLGLGTCLIAYWWAGHLAWGILASLGAIYSGLNSYNGVYQTRLRAIAGTAALVTLLTILGTLVSVSVWAAICAVTIVGFLFSLYAAVRPAANSLATVSTATLIILSKLLQAPNDIVHVALGNGILILSGGASQILMLTLFWPFTQFHPERRAVAEVYDSLTDFARRLGHGEPMQMLEGQSILDARDLMDSLRRYRMQPEQFALRRALSNAEGIRASLVALSSLSEAERPVAESYFRGLSERLEAVSTVIREGQILHLPETQKVLAPEGLPSEAGALVAVTETLLDQLRSPIDDDGEASAPAAGWMSHLSFRGIALESSPSLRAIALRHAVRLAATLFVTMCLARFGGFGNGYWIPMTACFILRMDYATTLERGLSRAAGTFVGVLIALGLGHFLPAGPASHVPVVLAASFGLYTVYRANYALYSILITIWVMFSITAAGLPGVLVGGNRLIATLVGTAFALVAYRLLPTWQSTRVSEVLSDAAASQIDFCQRVLLQQRLPSKSIWERELDRTRALRYEAEAVVAAASKEPGWKKNRSAVSVSEVLAELESNASQLLGLLATRLTSAVIEDDMRVRAEVAEERAKSLMHRLCPDPLQF
jgi:uncharacterized membrane protein YccC